NGRTWKQNVMEANLPKADWPTEQCGIYLGDGRIIAITRCEVCDDCLQRRQFQLQSTDFGKTWTKMRTNIGDVKISTPSLVYDASTGLLFNYYYHRGKGFLKRRVVPLEKIWDHPLDWPDFELVATGSANDHHAGNVNVIADGDIHYCTYYSGDENNTAVVLFAAQGTKET
ncbi:MAG: exo-alpha-sialidase, partial [Victivallales bacterium]|nr:exo-alpha-sialidase [Victivallales bacterium]